MARGRPLKGFVTSALCDMCGELSDRDGLLYGMSGKSAKTVRARAQSHAERNGKGHRVSVVIESVTLYDPKVK